MALPQARQLARTRSTDGVSPTWVGVSLALNGWWLAYGLAAHVWALVPVSMISFLLYLSMAVVFVGSRRPTAASARCSSAGSVSG